MATTVAPGWVAQWTSFLFVLPFQSRPYPSISLLHPCIFPLLTVCLSIQLSLCPTLCVTSRLHCSFQRDSKTRWLGGMYRLLLHPPSLIPPSLPPSLPHSLPTSFPPFLSSSLPLCPLSLSLSRCFNVCMSISVSFSLSVSTREFSTVHLSIFSNWTNVSDVRLSVSSMSRRVYPPIAPISRTPPVSSLYCLRPLVGFTAELSRMRFQGTTTFQYLLFILACMQRIVVDDKRSTVTLFLFVISAFFCSCLDFFFLLLPRSTHVRK